MEACLTNSGEERKKPVRHVFGRLKDVPMDIADEARGPVNKLHVIELHVIELRKDGLRWRRKFGKSWTVVPLSDLLAAGRLLKEQARERASRSAAEAEADSRQMKMFEEAK